MMVSTTFGQHDHPLVQDTSKHASTPKSPRLETMQMVGSNHVHIDYGSPSVRGRVIWNGLVSYNQTWPAGAHSATSITFSEDVSIDGTTIPKGKYGFFIIPDKKLWTLIINKSWNMHLADDYKKENDLVRIKQKPVKRKTISESLRYDIKSTKSGYGVITMSWEYLTISFEFKNK